MALIKPLVIGKITLKNNLMSAPLAGYTDIAFRKLCREYGAGLTTTEMVSARGLVYSPAKTGLLLQTADNETPSCAQLFGSEPDFFRRALQSEKLDKFDLIDINMGCPMPKITKNGDGSALLKNPALAAEIVKTCVKSGRTVTVKVRLGIDDKKNAPEFCRTIESVGAQLITVHGRTAEQMYGGKADWDAIGNIAASVAIPVIGNGDIDSVPDAEHKLKTYGVAGLMIGRGAIGRPDIFRRIAGGSEENLKTLILKHIRYSLDFFPENYVVKTLRKQFVWYLKGIPGIKDLKAALVKMTSVQDMISAIENAPL